MRNLMFIGIGVFFVCVIIIFITLGIKGSQADPNEEEKYKSKLKEKNASQNVPYDLHTQLNKLLGQFRDKGISAEEKLKYENQMRDIIKEIKSYDKYYSKKKKHIDSIAKEIDSSQ